MDHAAAVLSQRNAFCLFDNQAHDQHYNRIA
jgi:hypothetical protein